MLRLTTIAPSWCLTSRRQHTRLLSLLFRVTAAQKSKKLTVKESSKNEEYVDLDTYIGRNKEHLNKKDVVAMFLESSKRKIRTSRLLDLSTAINREKLSYDAKALSVIVCGLQIYSSSDSHAKKLLSVVCDRLEHRSRDSLSNPDSPILDHALKWSAAECTNVLYGLKGMSSASPEVGRLLALLPKHSQSFTPCTRVSAKMLAKGLYGLQNMSSDDNCTRQVLCFYRRFVLSCSEQLDEQALSHCLFGLQGCSSDHSEVRELLSALLALVRHSYCHSSRSVELLLQPRSVGAAVFGLKRMSNEHAVVEEVVGAISDLAMRGVPSPAVAAKSASTLAHRGEYDARTLGSAFLGLQQMHCSPSTERLLQFLRQQLHLCSPNSLNELALVNMFYGMQNMKSEVREVQQVLGTITKKLMLWIDQSPSHQMSLRGVASCLFGLKQMSESDPQVTRAMTVLRKQLVLIPSRHRKSSTGHSAERLRHQSTGDDFNSKVVSLASGVFQNMHSGSVEVRRMVKTQAAVWSALGLAQGLSELPRAVKNSSGKKRGGDCSSAGRFYQWDSQAVGNVLYNMRNLSNEHDEVRDMLEIVWSQGLRHHQQRYDPKLASAASDTGSERVKKKCLTSGPINLLAVSQCLYGLRSMTSEYGTHTLAAIGNTLAGVLEQHHSVMAGAGKSSSSGLITQQVCMALYGLQGCSDKHDFVRRLAQAFANLLCSDAGRVDILTLSNSVLGMQSLSNEHSEVRDLLSALTRHLALCETSSSTAPHVIGTSVGNILYGLQAMRLSSDKEGDELEALLILVHQKLVLPFATKASIDSVQRSLFGIASILSNSPLELTATPALISVIDMVDSLLERLSLLFDIDLASSLNVENTSALGEHDPHGDIVPLFQSLCLLKHSIIGRQDKKFDQIVSKLDCLLQLLKPALPQSDGDYNKVSVSERIFYDHISDHIRRNSKGDNMSVHLSEMVNGFSTDILLRYQSSDDMERVSTLNIEIDGPSHAFPRRKRFSKLRDEFLLLSGGVTRVKRVDLRGLGNKGSRLDATLNGLMDDL